MKLSSLCYLLIFTSSIFSISLAEEVEVDAEQEVAATAVPINAQTLVAWGSEGNIDEITSYVTSNSQSKNINAQNERGFTALIGATSKGHVDLVHFLINNGADVNIAENDAWSPLMFAAYSGSEVIVEKLIQKGAKINARNVRGGTAWTIAKNRNFPKCFDVITVAGIRKAILEKNITFVLELIRDGAAPNTQTNSGWTSLIYASASGNTNAVKELIQSGADVNLAESDGWSPLMFAANNGFVEIAKLLLANGANVLHKSKTGQTPLSRAEIFNKPEIVELIKNAVNDAINKNKATLTTATSVEAKKASDIVTADQEVSTTSRNEGKVADVSVANSQPHEDEQQQQRHSSRNTQQTEKKSSPIVVESLKITKASSNGERYADKEVLSSQPKIPIRTTTGELAKADRSEISRNQFTDTRMEIETEHHPEDEDEIKTVDGKNIWSAIRSFLGL